MPAGVVKPGTEKYWEEAKAFCVRKYKEGSDAYWRCVNGVYQKMMANRARRNAALKAALSEGRGAGDKKWIQRAIKHPGKLRAQAQRAGAIRKDGTIDPKWLREQCRKGNRAACLAITLRRIGRRRRGS